MAFNHERSVNEEQVASFLQDALKHVNEASDDDIELLNAIKKYYKKNIPWSRRKYVVSYLVKQAMQGKGSRYSRSDRNERFSGKDKKSDSRIERTSDRSFKSESVKVEKKAAARPASENHAEKAPRVHIDPSLATTIFIGIGRNRRVYPRDLVGLLVSVAGLDRDRIGDIRVLANYSFIQLFTEDCEKTIKALDNYEYRGRKLSVSYSKQKEDILDESKTEETSIPISQNAEEENIPSDVSNDSYGVAETSESDKIAEEQVAFAAAQNSTPVTESSYSEPYSETTDDGQVKSHFGNGAAY